MTMVRRFRGHERLVPPLGLRASAAAEAAPEEVISDEVEGAEPVELVAEPIVLPTSRAKVAELDAFAEAHGITFPEDADKLAKREAIEEWAAGLPELTDEGATENDDEE